MKIERGLISILILLIAGMMSLFSHAPIYRILPLIFGVASLTGYIVKMVFVFDTGIFLTIISYLFANGGIPITLPNLLMIIVFFFLFIGIWFYGRNILLISGIKGRGESSDIQLSKFRRSLISEIFSTLSMGVLLSILASFLILYSSLGIEMGSMVETLLMVILSATVFIITFLIIKLLSSQDIKIESEL